MTILQASDPAFVRIAGTACANNWELYQLKSFKKQLWLDWEPDLSSLVSRQKWYWSRTGGIDPVQPDPILRLEMENGKLRSIPHTVVPPLSVSAASNGVACVLAARMQALVYILDEDEDEISDSE
ncbi:hypothetical protein NL676_007143 [Syzygium grande]|nr:hypothetical protein NL676_007143 [Syzygium grande]